MDAFLGFWDRVELWLVTLPFPLQVAIMLTMGIPVFLLAAAGTERVADVLVRAFRGLVTPRPVSDRKEVR